MRIDTPGKGKPTAPALPFLPKIISFLGYVPLSLLPEDQGERIAVCRKPAGLGQNSMKKLLHFLFRRLMELTRLRLSYSDHMGKSK